MKMHFAAKMNRKQLLTYARLLFRLWWPATVFIGVCTGHFVVFIYILGMVTMTWNSPLFIGSVWLLLLIFYIILGIIFTHFAARHLHGAFGSEAQGVQRRMAFLSGVPFYALWLLSMKGSVEGMLFPDVNALTTFISIVGVVGFGLVSLGYLLILRFFLGRLTARTHQ